MLKHTFDFDFELTAAIQKKCSSVAAQNSEVFNLVLWSAAHFNHSEHLHELLLTSSLLSVPIDLQTYLKCASTIFETPEAEPGNKAERLNYLQMVFQNEFENDFEALEFGLEVLQERVSHQRFNELESKLPEFDLYKGFLKSEEPHETDEGTEDQSDAEAGEPPKQRKQIFDIDYSNVSFATSRRNFVNQRNRNKAYPEMMNRAARQLKKLNSKAEYFQKADKAVEVTEDPNNGKP